MRNHSVVYSKLFCPYCNRRLSSGHDSVVFCWGRTNVAYRVGDPIRWLRDRRGNIVPPYHYLQYWSWLRLSYVCDTSTYNCGDANVESVLVLDFQLVDYGHGVTCSKCNNKADAIAVVISDNTITGIRVFRDGEILQLTGESRPFEIAVVCPDGTVRPRCDLYEQDHELLLFPDV